MQDQDTTAIKCRECGAPSYFDQKLEGFICPYCGSFTPWASADYRYTLDMIFRHRPIPLVDGLIKLTHVGVGETAVKDMRSPDEMKQRTSSLDDLLQGFDQGTFEKWDIREEKSFDCPYCGAQITGFSTQSIFECPYCGNKVMLSELFESGEYGENLVYGYDPDMYDLALPFIITKEQAIQQMLRLVAENRSDFTEQDIEKRIRSELQAIYLPYWVEDISVKATVDTERGQFTFYHDRINWARPQCSLFDIYLLNELNPWDYGESAPFTPTFLENDVRIFAPMNNDERVTAPYRMLYRDMPDMLKSAFDLNEIKMLGWVTDFRRHKYASINLPIWFLDKPSWASKSDLQTRMAVNAQTGKAAALFLEAGKKDYTRTLDAYPPPKMSDECTLYSPPVPVKYIKSPFLFKTLNINDVLGKPRSKFRRLFKS
jgi:DNA-directed RNA polymerase subunit RPC12/RpoP